MWYCTRCRAQITAEASQCWRCGHTFTPAVVAYPPHMFPHMYGGGPPQQPQPQMQYVHMPRQKEGFLHGLGRALWLLITTPILLFLIVVLSRL